MFRSLLISARHARVVFAAAVLTLASFTLAEAKSLSPPVSAIVVDLDDGRAMYARNADARRYPASLAKVMTLYLTFEALADGRLKPTDRIRVSPRAAAQPPSKIGLRSGSSLTVEEAMNLLVVKSANDVATAVAEKLAGSEARFAQRMTAKARALGMTKTRFANASGLPDRRQVTTARDMAILGRAVLHDFPEHAGVFNQSQTRFRGRLVRGHNRVLSTKGVDGMKTGYTRASGFNLMTSAHRDGHGLLAIVLGGATSASRDDYMRQLVGAGFKVAAKDDGALTMAKLMHGEGPVRDAIVQEMAQGSADLPAATPRNRWAVQVGAFAEHSRAERAAAKARGDDPTRFAKDRELIEAFGRLHVVRFTGFSKAAAKTACRDLKAAGSDCLALRLATP